MDILPRICFDTNAKDEGDRHWLHLVGSLEDIKRIGPAIHAGMRVLLYMEDLEVEATLEFNHNHGTWVGVPDWSTLRYI